MIAVKPTIDLDDLAQRYCRAYSDVSITVAKQAFINFPDNVIANSKMAFMYIKINGATLRKLKRNPMLLMESDFLLNCYYQNGPYIHLLKIFGVAQGFRSLIKELVVLNKPKSISYFRDDMKILHTVYQRS